MDKTSEFLPGVFFRRYAPHIIIFAVSLAVYIFVFAFFAKETAAACAEIYRYNHTTCREAGALAAAAAVRRLWLTHYSAAVTDTAPGLAAARTAYPLALAGYDGMAQELEFDKE